MKWNYSSCRVIRILIASVYIIIVSDDNIWRASRYSNIGPVVMPVAASAPRMSPSRAKSIQPSRQQRHQQPLRFLHPLCFVTCPADNHNIVLRHQLTEDVQDTTTTRRRNLMDNVNTALATTSRRVMASTTPYRRRSAIMTRLFLQSSTADDDDDSNNSIQSGNRQSTTATTANSTSTTATITRRRAQISGVSVSNTGLYVILRIPLVTFNNSSSNSNIGASPLDNTPDKYNYIPIQVTDDPLDCNVSVSSPEALTILQLLSSVDMAGPILPPELLSQLVVLTCEAAEAIEPTVEEDETNEIENQNDDDGDRISSKQVVSRQQQFIINSVQKQLQEIYVKNNIPQQNVVLRYSDEVKNGWIRSRVRLPPVTLDEVRIQCIRMNDNMNHGAIRQFVLLCSIRDETNEKSSILVNLSNNVNDKSDAILEDVCYQYRPDVSAAFIAIALSLRYKVPIITEFVPSGTDITQYDDFATASSSSSFSLLSTQHELFEQYPLYRTIETLQQRSNTVQANVERGFEYTKLQQAYRIAIEKSDRIAAEKIQIRLTELAALNIRDNIPVQPESDTSSMQ